MACGCVCVCVCVWVWVRCRVGANWPWLGMPAGLRGAIEAIVSSMEADGGIVDENNKTGQF